MFLFLLCGGGGVGFLGILVFLVFLFLVFLVCLVFLESLEGLEPLESLVNPVGSVYVPCISSVPLPGIVCVSLTVLFRGLAPLWFRSGFVGGPGGLPSCVPLFRLLR